MDASRAYYGSLKQYDPFRDLWKSLVERSSDDPRLTQLSREEQRYFAVSLLEGEVYNGGFDQFFRNSSGDHCHLAATGLEELGASSSLAILREAAQTVFGSASPPVNQSERCRIMDSRTSRLPEVLNGFRQASRLEHLDKRFCEDPDHLGDRLRAYAADKDLVAPFLRNSEAIGGPF